MKRRAFIAGAVSSVVTPAISSATLENAEAIAGDRFTVGADEFHLADIIAPSAHDLHRDAQPYFREAKTALNRFLAGATIVPSDVAPPNRWSARQVTARRAGDPKTLQELLVAEGAARVNPMTENHALIDALFALEAAARENGNGLWALNAYRVFDAGNAEGAVGAFHLVEGRVQSANAGRGRFYLNFGADFRDDFTATAPSRRARRWARGGLDLATLENARVRVRGFVQSINGPSIEMSHVKALELLS